MGRRCPRPRGFTQCYDETPIRKGWDGSMDVTYAATLTCPHCGALHAETMSDSSCQFFYRCDDCGAMLRPAEGDC
jgi:hypothetical protein